MLAQVGHIILSCFITLKILHLKLKIILNNNRNTVIQNYFHQTLDSFVTIIIEEFLKPGRMSIAEILIVILQPKKTKRKKKNIHFYSH